VTTLLESILKQNVVAGGRLAGSGGDFEKDGGFGLNPQGIKKIESHLMWKVYGNVLDPDSIPADQIEAIRRIRSCFKDIEEEVLDRTEITADGKDLPIYRKEKKRARLPASSTTTSVSTWVRNLPRAEVYFSCAEKFGVLIPRTRMDANEVVNLRVLFCAPPGWTLFTVDYSNIEMRCAANFLREPEFLRNSWKVRVTSTRSLPAKIWPEFTDPKTSKASVSHIVT
jgi:hypothetical protein